MQRWMESSKDFSFSFRSMDRSYTAVVTKMPPPSLITLRLKSRSFSSGNTQSDFLVFLFNPTSYTVDVDVDDQLRDNSRF